MELCLISRPMLVFCFATNGCSLQSTKKNQSIVVPVPLAELCTQDRLQVKNGYGLRAHCTVLRLSLFWTFFSAVAGIICQPVKRCTFKLVGTVSHRRGDMRVTYESITFPQSVERAREKKKNEVRLQTADRPSCTVACNARLLLARHQSFARFMKLPLVGNARLKAYPRCSTFQSLLPLLNGGRWKMIFSPAPARTR